MRAMHGRPGRLKPGGARGPDESIRRLRFEALRPGKDPKRPMAHGSLCEQRPSQAFLEGHTREFSAAGARQLARSAPVMDSRDGKQAETQAK